MFCLISKISQGDAQPRFVQAVRGLRHASGWRARRPAAWSVSRGRRRRCARSGARCRLTGLFWLQRPRWVPAWVSWGCQCTAYRPQPARHHFRTSCRESRGLCLDPPPFLDIALSGVLSILGTEQRLAEQRSCVPAALRVPQKSFFVSAP